MGPFLIFLGGRILLDLPTSISAVKAAKRGLFEQMIYNVINVLKIQTRVSCLGKAPKCGTVFVFFRWENSCGPSDIYIRGEGCKEGIVRTNDKVSMSKIQTRVSCLGKAPKCGTVFDFFRWENSCGPSDIYIRGEGCKEGMVRTNDSMINMKIQTRVCCLGKAPKCGTVFECFRWQNSCGPSDIYICGEGCKGGMVRTNDSVINI